MKIRIKNKMGFTFVELVTTITIIAILSTIGFITYYKNIEDSRDSQRESDLSGLATGLKTYKTTRGQYPSTSTGFNITNNGTKVATQGLFDKSIVISTIEKIPEDPHINHYYVYSTTNNNQEFELSATLENNGKSRALLLGDYKSVSKNILPTIVLAIDGTGDIEIADGVGDGATNRTKFVFNEGRHNLAYSFDYPYSSYSDGTSFNDLLSDTETDWWQNSDYINCEEIQENSKFIGTGEYQINSGGTLVNTTCP